MGHERARTREIDARRGSRQERGYGQVHVRVRKQWEPKVAAGVVPCSRCGLRIAPGEVWHLDHDDHDRTRYRGPSHALCNQSAGGKRAHSYVPEGPFPQSRAW